MASRSTDVPTRNFNPMSVPGLSDDARKAVTAAFDALSAWRAETVSTNEKNSERVIEKMATAAEALGWPEQIVEATRAQMQGIIKGQVQMMDHVMDAWEEQIKSPNPASAMLSKLRSLPGFGAADADALQKAALNPFGAYLQFADQWQKTWTDAMAFWTKAGRTFDTAGQRRY